MEWVETTGRTLEEAREAALDQLGVDDTDAEFEILEQPRPGLFGRMRGEARVRARVRPTAPRAKEDRRDRRRRAKAGGGAQAAAPGSQGAVDADDSAPSGALRGAGGRSGRRPSAAEPGGGRAEVESSGVAAGRNTPADREGADSRGGGAGDSESSGGGTATSGPRRRRRRRSGSSNGGSPESPMGTAGPTGTAAGPTGTAGPAGTGERAAPQRVSTRSENGNTQRRDGTEVEVPLQEQGRVAEDFLSGLITEFGLTARVTLNEREDENLDLALAGNDLGLLIGQKGATLLAVQDLTRTVVQHKTGATNGRIHVDIGGYRQKRSEALAKFALEVATQVKQSGQRAALEPMNAADRKVVHDALTDVDGVATVSEGEDPRRRVVVVPSE